MTARDVLEAMSQSDTLADEVVQALDAGMWNEWDCPLVDEIGGQFGGEELRLAAQAGLYFHKAREAARATS